jgi:hypothetical protein
MDKPCTRTDHAVRWVVFHAAELTGIAVLALLAVAITAWFGLLAVVVGVWWVAHEVRDTRRQREIRTAADRRRMTTGDAAMPTHTSTEPSKEARS